MPVGDAVQKIPTFEEQLAEFKGFSTKDGEVASGEPTDEEKAAGEARDAADAAAKSVAAGEPVTDEKPEDEAANTEKTAKSEKDAAAKPQKKTAEERIAEVTRKYRAEQRERAALEQRIAALERGDTKPLTAAKAAAKDDAAPDPTKFQYGELDAQYIRALARYETRQELETAAKESKEVQQRDAAAREQREVAKQADAFKAKGAEKWDDFEEVVFEGAKSGEWPLSDALGKMLLTSEHGPAIAYHLATHPDEAETVFGKTPLEQAAWLGRQEAKQSPSSSGAAAKAAVKTTKAPLPPKEVAKGAGGNSSASEATNDFKAFERMAMAR